MTTATRTTGTGTADRMRIRDLADLSTHLAFWLPVANVVMQLAHPGVGHGVVESRVTSGRGDLRPIKRARTTTQYLAVATMGGEADRRHFHEEVHRIHAQVYSTESSPVSYNANSARLQLWVALCLVRYFTDQWEMLHGRLTDAERDHVVRIARPLGTTLNVPDQWWPDSWAEFDRHFREGLAEVRIDDTVRAHLQSFADHSVLEVRMKALGTLAHRTLGPWALSLTKFGVPPEIREQMRWEITHHDLRRRRRVFAVSRALGVVLPRPLRLYYGVNLAGVRMRRRLGISVF